jgi:DNA-binding transcriptional MerR regulator
MSVISHPTSAWAGQAPPKRYRIGELSAHTGLSRQTLHNYTRWGLIQAVGWTEGRHRLYDETAFARLAVIMAMKPGATVPQILAVLNGQPPVTDPPAAELQA